MSEPLPELRLLPLFDPTPEPDFFLPKENNFPRFFLPELLVASDAAPTDAEADPTVCTDGAGEVFDMREGVGV